MGWRQKFFRPAGLLDHAYEISIILKATGGLLECVAGMALLFISPLQVQWVVAAVTRAELLEDPQDFIARHLTDWSLGLGADATLFGAVYLLSHGIIKIGIVAALLFRQRWAYPTAIAVFGAFAVYQIYLTVQKASVGYALLTLYDLVVIYLVWLEYRKMRGRTSRGPEEATLSA
jgi:uncharacterized membrane protein